MKKRILALFLCGAMLLAACGTATNNGTDPSVATSDPVSVEAEGGLSFTPGTYEGTGKGFGGDINVSVTVDEKSIISIEVGENTETEGIGTVALPKLVDGVIAGQTIAVDSVSGATVTSVGFLEAAENALSKSGVDMALLKEATDSGDVGEKELVSKKTDVIVIGAGGAGLAAALTAKQNGKDVILLEKMPMVGGATGMAGGGTNATGSEWQKAFAIKDSPEILKADLFRNGHDKNDENTVLIYANTIGTAFDWLVDPAGGGVAYKNEEPKPSPENTVGRNFSADGGGPAVVESLKKSVEAAGVELMLETSATELIFTDSAIAGVKALAADGTPYEIEASSVIIATGGYGANDELMPEYVKGLPYAGAVSATGDGLKMAQAIGADAFDLDLVNVQPNSITLPDGRGQHTHQGSAKMQATTGSILVSEQGDRFINEGGVAYDVKEAMLKNEHTYLIMDEPSYLTYIETCIASRNFTQEQADEWLAANGSMIPVFAKGATLEELATTLNVTGEKLVASVEKYNGFVTAGTDSEFGRKVSEPMAAAGPYYAVEMSLRYYATLGGLRVDGNMQVVNTEGSAMQGLYAAGEVVGGLNGDNYLPGGLFGWAMASGYNAGLSATTGLEYEGKAALVK